jgi:hypothetical protein
MSPKTGGEIGQHHVPAIRDHPPGHPGQETRDGVPDGQWDTRENADPERILGEILVHCLESGALYLIRTDDPFITNEVLYQLS